VKAVKLNKEAFVWWNAGVCHVIDRGSRSTLSRSTDFRRATRRARNLGYNVCVYKGDHAKAPHDATQVSLGSYVLPATVKTQPRP
jgi:hypothetical protein